MKRVFVLSPLAPIKMPPGQNDISMESNLEFAGRCMLNCIARGESPFPPHKLYTQVLDDLLPNERETGIRCGLVWLAASEVIAVYVDRGISSGMRQELEAAVRLYRESQRHVTSGQGGEQDTRGMAQSIFDAFRSTDFRRLDGGPAPSWQWLHEQNVPHLRDVDGSACPICFGPAAPL